MENILKERSNNSCELCKSVENLKIYVVPPKEGATPDECAFLCDTCIEQNENPEKSNSKHWYILGDTMWSKIPAVQVLAYRLLHRLKDESWSMNLLDILYLDNDTKAWADSLKEEGIDLVHMDSNGNTLKNGDTVILINDIDFKGANFTVKRGTVIKDIRLDKDNAESLEGKINDKRNIVTLTKFVKKN